MKNIYIKLSVLLFVICSITAGALAVVNAITFDRIRVNEEYKESILRGRALAGSQDGPRVVFDERPVSINGADYYVGRLDGQVIGATVTTVTDKGYAGPIEIVLGMNGDKVTGVSIKSSSETPGLGANASAVKYGQTEPWFLSQFKGLSPAQVRLKKDNPQGAIDAITAATITSRAVTNAVQEKAQEFQDVWPQLKEQEGNVSSQ